MKLKARASRNASCVPARTETEILRNRGIKIVNFEDKR